MGALTATVLLLATLVVQPVSSGGRWTSGTPLAIAVMDGRATVLRDGRVVITGGYAEVGGWPVRETQVYDPSTSQWSIVPSMHAGRTGDTATRLRDGRVLVIGGLGVRLKALRSAEIFDPVRLTWTLTAPLPQPRFSHSASLLPDGTVLVAGGIAGGRITRSVLVYDPVRDRWSSGPPTYSPHAEHSSIALPDSSILIAGGYGGGPEIYHPRLHTWSRTAFTPGRQRAVMTALVDGTVLLAGGESRQYHDLRSARLFDTRTDNWRSVGSMHVPRNGATAIRLPDGEVLVAGGEQVVGRVLNSAEIYDPASQAWLQAPALQTARGGAIGTPLPDGRSMVCGGANFGGVIAGCEIYQPASPANTNVPPAP